MVNWLNSVVSGLGVTMSVGNVHSFDLPDVILFSIVVAYKAPGRKDKWDLFVLGLRYHFIIFFHSNVTYAEHYCKHCTYGYECTDRDTLTHTQTFCRTHVHRSFVLREQWDTSLCYTAIYWFIKTFLTTLQTLQTLLSMY